MCLRCHALRCASEVSVSNIRTLDRLGWHAAKATEKSSYIPVNTEMLTELAGRWEMTLTRMATIPFPRCDFGVKLDEVLNVLQQFYEMLVYKEFYGEDKAPGPDAITYAGVTRLARRHGDLP
eukprot:Lankesteria_metandrocarpae@DN5275_c0_g1_i2.p2